MIQWPGALDWWNALQIWDQTVIVTVAGIITFGSIIVVRRLLGKISMRTRERERRRLQEAIREILGQSFKETVEDKLVCEIMKAIGDGRLSHDDARKIYAHYAYLGFWGLHPRKLNIIASPLEQTLLKERLMKKFWPDRFAVYAGTTVTTNEQAKPVIISAVGLLSGLRKN